MNQNELMDHNPKIRIWKHSKRYTCLDRRVYDFFQSQLWSPSPCTWPWYFDPGLFHKVPDPLQMINTLCSTAWTSLARRQPAGHEPHRVENWAYEDFDPNLQDIVKEIAIYWHLDLKNRQTRDPKWRYIAMYH